MDLWRVQSTWTVDGEARSYRPQFVDSRAEADREKREMECTLSHFPTLDVTVEQVTLKERDAELASLAAEEEPRTPVHLMLDPYGPMACGLERAKTKTSSVDEIFDLSPRDTCCPVCLTYRDNHR